jgi:hypothetical protein
LSLGFEFSNPRYSTFPSSKYSWILPWIIKNTRTPWYFPSLKSHKNKAQKECKLFAWKTWYFHAGRTP